MNKAAYYTIVLLIFALHISTSAQAQYAVERFVFGNGGSETWNSENHVIGTLGQPVIGVTINPSTQAKLGFWYNVDGAPVGVATEHPYPVFMKLNQNYPNPFSLETTIPYTLAKASHLSLKVYNMLGKEVATLADERQSAGEHTAYWRPGNLPGGLYFIALRADGQTMTRKIVLRGR